MDVMMQNLWRVLFCGMVLIASGYSASAQDTTPLPELVSKRLLNGLQITVAPTPLLGDRMAIGLVVRYGSAYDPEGKAGLANLLSRMFLKATADNSQKDIQDELAGLGASIEVRCDWDGFRFLLRGQSPKFERSLLLLYQIVGEAQFNEDDFYAERQSVFQEFKKTVDPRKKMRTQLENALFSGTTYGRPREGTIASLSAITLGDVRFFYHKFFSPSQASLEIVGNVPPPLVLQKATRIWGVWVRLDDTPFTFSPPRNPAGRTIFLDDDPNSPAAQFMLGNFFPSREDPDYPNVLLAVHILEARLNEQLPTSFLAVGKEGRRKPGPLYIQGQAAIGQTLDQIQKIQSAVEEMKRTLVSDSELSAARKQVLEEFSRPLRSPDGLCNLLLDTELYRLGSNYAVSFADRIRRCDEDAIKQAANDWIFPGGEILVIRGPVKILQPMLEPLGTVHVLNR
jgi:zinc protease